MGASGSSWYAHETSDAGGVCVDGVVKVYGELRRMMQRAAGERKVEGGGGTCGYYSMKLGELGRARWRKAGRRGELGEIWD